MPSWSSDAIVLNSAPHGEHASRVILLTREHGIRVGILPNGQSPKRRAALQAGTHVVAKWRARMAEHMGTISLEAVCIPVARWMSHQAMLITIASACALSARVLPENQPTNNVYENLSALTLLNDGSMWGQRAVKWEVDFLAAVGYGLDLSRCALSGERHGLAYVSPITGRAVTAKAGEPWKNRLLELPDFLVGGSDVSQRAIVKGLRLTEFFLLKNILSHMHGNRRELPAARQRLAEMALSAQNQQSQR